MVYGRFLCRGPNNNNNNNNDNDNDNTNDNNNNDKNNDNDNNDHNGNTTDNNIAINITLILQEYHCACLQYYNNTIITITYNNDIRNIIIMYITYIIYIIQ